MADIKAIQEKLDKEEKGGKFDRYASAMKGYVKKTLLQLCGENEAFAESVLQGDVFEDCMKAVAKGVSNSISDLEVMKRAVGFYMKGADIRFQMVIVAAGNQAARKEDKNRKTQEVIDLTDFF